MKSRPALLSILAQFILAASIANISYAKINHACEEAIEKFVQPSLTSLKNKAREDVAHIPLPVLADPQQEIANAALYNKAPNQPKLISDTMPPDMHVINHALKSPNEDGVVKTNSGFMAHVRGYFKGIGTNFGVNILALMDNLTRKNKSVVREDADAVIVFIHGGGTNTTGHHVAVALMNFFTSHKVDVVSLDLPWHGEGPNDIEDGALAIENALESIELVRNYVKKYVSPSGKPVFLAGHSMGGVFSDVYRRFYPNDTLFKGLIPLSTVADAAPGKSIEEKMLREAAIHEANKTNPAIPAGERDMTAALAEQNKLAPICGAYCGTIIAAVDWSKPEHMGADYLPALYIIGEGDELYQGNQHNFKNYVADLKNTELVVYGKRKLFGGKGHIEVVGDDISQEDRKKITTGKYYGRIDQKELDSKSAQEKLLLRDHELLRLKSEGKINFDDKFLAGNLEDLFKDEAQTVGHLIFDHKPLITYSPDVPAEIQEKIASGKYYGTKYTPKQIEDIKDPVAKSKMRQEAIDELRKAGKMSYDPKYSADELTQIETFVLMKKFMEKTLGKSLSHHRLEEVKPINNIVHTYVNNLAFRVFADKFILQHVKGSGETKVLGPLQERVSSELRALEKIKVELAPLLLDKKKDFKAKLGEFQKTADRLKSFVYSRQVHKDAEGKENFVFLEPSTDLQIELQLIFAEIAHANESDEAAQLAKLNGTLSNFIDKVLAPKRAEFRDISGKLKGLGAEDPANQKELDQVLAEINELSSKVGANNKRNEQIKNGPHGIDKFLKNKLSSAKKAVNAVGETLSTQLLDAARADKKSAFEAMMKQDEVVRIELNNYLEANRVNGRYRPNLFRNMPQSLKDNFKTFIEKSNEHQKMVAQFNHVLHSEIFTANAKSKEIAANYKLYSDEMKSAESELEFLENDTAKLSTKIFKLQARKANLIGNKYFKTEFHTIRNILESGADYMNASPENAKYMNTLLQDMWREWQKVWGSRVPENNNELY
jgi:pimeloyl-ACP methyl ester carboxylesterase